MRVGGLLAILAPLLASEQISAQQWGGRIFGKRFQDVGVLVNPTKPESRIANMAGGLKPGVPGNLTVDTANFVSLRSFLGLEDRSSIKTMSDRDTEVPSVEEFLYQKITGLGSRMKEAEIGPDGESGRRKLNVYGQDQRSNFDWTMFPDRAFGKLMFPSAYYCTGELIGKRYVLTAAHCFFSYGNQIDGQNMYYSVFRAGYRTINGQHFYEGSSGWGKLWYGTTYPEVYRNSDWAIIQLDTPLGEKQGYLGLNPTDLRNQLPIEDKIELIGYSQDGYSQTAGKDPRCSLEDFFQGVYFHNCDCEAGASGGALLDPSNNIVGINTAHIMPKDKAVLVNDDFNADYPNIAVPTWQFMPTYAHILQDEQ